MKKDSKFKRYAVDSVITKMKSGWIKFRDLISLFTSQSLSFEAKGRLQSYVYDVIRQLD